MSPQVRRAFIALLLLLLLAVVQVAVAPLISVLGVIPSLLLIGTVFVSLREGQLTAMLVSFPAGLMTDAYFSGLVGITSLGLTVAAFAAGFFYDEEKSQLIIRSPRAVAVVFMSALLFHFVYLFSYFQSLDLHILGMIGAHVFGASIYTTVLSSIPVLIMARSASRLKV